MEVLSSKTALDMYNYLLSTKLTSQILSNSNNEDYLKNSIKDIAKKLYLTTKLYNCKLILKKSKDNRLIKIKYSKSISNSFLFSVLHEINETRAFASNKLGKELDLTAIDLDSEEFYETFYTRFSDIHSSNKLREQLIDLCKLYAFNTRLTKNEKDNIDKLNIYTEYKLVESTLSKYSEQRFKANCNVLSQEPFEGYDNRAQLLIPDIIIYNDNTLLVIDVKVYKNLADKKSKHSIKSGHEYVYHSNGNRFQLNSYIDKCKEKFDCYNTKQTIAIILHVVSSNCSKIDYDMDKANLSIIQEKPILLHIIKDNGLEKIFKSYEQLIEYYINNASGMF